MKLKHYCTIQNTDTAQQDTITINTKRYKQQDITYNTKTTQVNKEHLTLTTNKNKTLPIFIYYTLQRDSKYTNNPQTKNKKYNWKTHLQNIDIQTPTIQQKTETITLLQTLYQYHPIYKEIITTRPIYKTILNPTQK